VSIFGRTFNTEIKLIGQDVIKAPVGYWEHVTNALCQKAGMNAVKELVAEFPFIVTHEKDAANFCEKLKVKFSAMPYEYYVGLLRMQLYLHHLEEEVLRTLGDNKGGAMIHRAKCESNKI